VVYHLPDLSLSLICDLVGTVATTHRCCRRLFLK